MKRKTTSGIFAVDAGIYCIFLRTNTGNNR